MKTTFTTLQDSFGFRQENFFYLRKYTIFTNASLRIQFKLGTGCLFIFVSKFFHGEPLPDVSKTPIKLFSLLKDDLLLTAPEK